MNQTNEILADLIRRVDKERKVVLPHTPELWQKVEDLQKSIMQDRRTYAGQDDGFVQYVKEKYGVNIAVRPKDEQTGSIISFMYEDLVRAISDQMESLPDPNNATTQ